MFLNEHNYNFQLYEQGKLNADSAQYLMLGALQSLPIHGNDEVAVGPLLGLCHQIYAILVCHRCSFINSFFNTFQRPEFASLRDLLRQIPECSDEVLTAYDSKVINATARKDITEKTKRDMIRRLVNGIIGVYWLIGFKTMSWLNVITAEYWCSIQTTRSSTSIAAIATNIKTSVC